MRKYTITLVLTVLVLSFFSTAVLAHEGMNMTYIKQLIDSGVSCSELSDEQLEESGEYYMEQMHPGEAHELMHKAMGIEEGTESHEKFHVNLAKTIYCGESNQGMMGGFGMMNFGMMNWGSGMMDGLSLAGINQILFTIALVLAILLMWKMYTKKK